MKCEEGQPQIEAYAMGALSLEEMTNLKKHIDTCPACSALLERYDATIESLALEAGSFGSIFEPLEGHKERFIERLQERKQLRPGSKSVEELADEPAPKVPSRSAPKKKSRAGGWLRGNTGIISGIAALCFILTFVTGIWALSLQGELSALRSNTSATQTALVNNQKQEIDTLKQQNQQLLTEKQTVAQKLEALSQDSEQVRKQVVSMQNTMLLLSNPQVTTHETIKDSLRLKVVMAPDERKVALLTHSFPTLNAGESYFVWLHKGDNIVPVGEMDLIILPEPAIAEALVIAPEPMVNYTGISVTIQTKGTTVPTQRGREILRDTL
jgi:FtsZ-binding cell division protein ZapB